MPFLAIFETCSECEGSGHIKNKMCGCCNGLGKVKTKYSILVRPVDTQLFQGKMKKVG